MFICTMECKIYWMCTEMSSKVKDGLHDIAPRGQMKKTLWDSCGYRIEHPQYYDISVVWESDNSIIGLGPPVY